MDIRINYSSNIEGHEDLAKKVADLAYRLGHTCMMMPMLNDVDEGPYPTMEMFADGYHAFGSSWEIREALNNGTIERGMQEDKGIVP